MTTAPRRSPRGRATRTHSKPVGRVVNLGRLSTAAWPGTLSADGSGLEVRELIVGLDGYYVPVGATAPTRMPYEANSRAHVTVLAAREAFADT